MTHCQAGQMETQSVRLKQRDLTRRHSMTQALHTDYCHDLTASFETFWNVRFHVELGSKLCNAQNHRKWSWSTKWSNPYLSFQVGHRLWTSNWISALWFSRSVGGTSWKHLWVKTMWYWSLQVAAYIVKATAKNPVILNMYWTDMGLWTFMEIVKTHEVSQRAFPN